MDEPASKAVVRYAKVCADRLEEDPRDPDALFALAAILAAAERPGEALEILNILAQSAPRYPGLWVFKARVYRDMGDARMESLCLAADAREGLQPKLAG